MFVTKVWIVVLLSLSAYLVSVATEFDVVSSRESVETRFLQDSLFNFVVLYDESRSIWILLTNTQALFTTQGGDPDADYWYLIGQNADGYWASDYEFVTATGSFRQDYAGVVWLEYQKGKSEFNSYVRINQDDPSVNPTYTAYSNSKHVVVLYDKSRNYWVMLTDNQAFYSQKGGDPKEAYWYLIRQYPTGYWITDSQFITQTGYFIQQNGGDEWIEQQVAASYDYVRQQTDTQAKSG